METSTETVQRLMEVGCIAAGNGLFGHAENIFRGVQAVRPESELPEVGRAIAKMTAGRFQEAVSILQEALAKNPDSDIAMAFLGMALHLGGFGQAAQDVLQQVIDADRDPAAVSLASSILEPE